MEPNGVQQSQQQAPVAPQQQQQQQVQPQQQQTQQFQQPTTPQVQYQPIDPRTGQITQPQQTQQPQQQQISEEAIAARLRNDLAASFNLNPNDLPSSYAELLRINAGAVKIMQRQQMEQQQASLPPRQPEVVQAQTQTSPLVEKQLPPGWQNLVQKDASGQWQPTSPHFLQIAQDANYNEAIRESRRNALTSGQLLPEHQQSVEQIVNQRLAVEREQLRGEMFINQHRADLYELNPDGTVKTQIDPMTMQPAEVRTPLGIEMRSVAEELKKYGARFDSAVDLANMALTIAKERVKLKQAQQPQNMQPQQPQYNRDLQNLLDNHQKSGAAQAGTVNTAPQQFKDFRSEMRSVLQNVPDNASSMELAKALGLNFGI